MVYRQVKKREKTMSGNATSTESAVHLDRIGQIAISVSDLPRSKQFYGETLGMKFLFDAGPMAFYQCGQTRFMIGAGNEKTVVPGGTILYFTVDDINAVHASLVAQDVYFLAEPHLVAKMPDHDLWMAFLKDPDGYTIGLMSEIPHRAVSEGN
jgi:methylmalonyl-CoA/ethylmalonyl-CoA epimerase